MNRFFCKAYDISGHHIVIRDKSEAHHIKNVLRLRPGEKVIVSDENKNEYNCIIRQIKDEIYLEIESRRPQNKGNECVQLTIACAMPKKAKFDDIVDKLVQLGVKRIIPLKTARVVVKLDKHKEAMRLQRWEKIALAAVKQSQRSDVTVIDPVTSFEKLISQNLSEFDLKLIPHLGGERKGLREILDSFTAKPRGGPLKIVALIGPEGDFSEEEVGKALEKGFIPVTLGDLVMRVDTASIALASFVSLYANR